MTEKLTEEKIKERLKAKKIHERAKKGISTFNRELKKAMNTAIMAAFGFLIALVWRDVITEFVNEISSQSPLQGKLFSAILTTLICVLGILILTKLLSEEKIEKKDENKE
jgi:hypothetical protein